MLSVLAVHVILKKFNFFGFQCFKDLKFYFILCVGSITCSFVYAPYVCYSPQILEKHIRSLGIRVTDACGLSRKY